MTTPDILYALRTGGATSGLQNCHKRGIASIVLRPRVSDDIGMVRLFYATPGHELDRLYGDGDFCLAPHNHRQDITLELLFGYVTNVRFPLMTASCSPRGPFVYRYEFGSALLNGDFTLQLIHTFEAPTLSPELLMAGEPISLASDEIHTVVAQSKEAAWIVREGRVASHPSYCHSLKSDFSLDSAGLYLPMSQKELNAASLRIAERST